MAETFYPFVENGNSAPAPENPNLVVRHPARIAVFDDPAAAPRVVVVEPSDIRSFLESITASVTKLAQEQGGGIPFTVIREVVENLIHAYFIEPTVSILDGGNTIRFSDQGPGIADKQRALEYGTTSATAEMKRYIRGVGSGLPYAQQWLEDKGGSLTVEDNMHKGTVVTISLVHRGRQSDQPLPNTLNQLENTPIQQAFYQSQVPASPFMGQQVPQTYPQQTQPAWPQQMPNGYGFAPQPTYPAQQGYPAYQGYPQQAFPAQPSQQPSYGQPWYGQPTQQPYAQPYTQNTPAQQIAPQQQLSDRELMALEYLRTHDSVGPRDLNALHPLSESTWSRVLAHLESLGLIDKQGRQKRKLTQTGLQYLGIQ